MSTRSAERGLTSRRLASPGRHIRWHDAITDAGQPSPDGFVLYWRADIAPLMTTRGELRPGTAYLMGYDAVAGKIYHQDPVRLTLMPLCPFACDWLKRRPEAASRAAIDWDW